jgi:hypothetical protein
MGVIGNGSPAIDAADEAERSQHAAGVIEMAMRENDGFDDSEIDPEALGVALEGVFFGAAVEQDGMADRTAMRGHEAGEAMAGAAQTVARQFRRAAAPAECGASDEGRVPRMTERNAGCGRDRLP